MSALRFGYGEDAVVMEAAATHIAAELGPNHIFDAFTILEFATKRILPAFYARDLRWLSEGERQIIVYALVESAAALISKADEMGVRRFSFSPTDVVIGKGDEGINVKVYADTSIGQVTIEVKINREENTARYFIYIME